MQETNRDAGRKRENKDLEKNKNMAPGSLVDMGNVHFLKKHRNTELPPSMGYQMQEGDGERGDAFGRSQGSQRYERPERFSQAQLTSNARDSIVCDSQRLTQNPFQPGFSTSSATYTGIEEERRIRPLK
jgi:hypothetical protein